MIILDCNNMAYTSYFAMRDLETDEMKTGAIFGFMDCLFNLAEYFQSTNFVFCWDSKSNLRKKASKDYKNRDVNKTPEELKEKQEVYKQIKELRVKIIPELGFKNSFCCKGYEADDIMAWVALTNKKKEKFIVTTDQDLYQMIKPGVRCRIYNFKTKKIIDYKTFVKKYHIAPKHWVMVKTLGGCNSDNVIGLKNIGEKKAINFIRNKMNKKTATYAKLKDAEEQLIKINKPLVKLPYKGKNFSFKIKRNDLKQSNFINVFDRYDFRSFLAEEEWSKWVKLFDLKH